MKREKGESGKEEAITVMRGKKRRSFLLLRMGKKGEERRKVLTTSCTPSSDESNPSGRSEF